MSISNAMQASVSGLRANAAAAGNVSSNIANANTDGYRRTFSQFVTSTVSVSGFAQVPPGGVRAVQTADVDVDGQLRATQRATDLGISGPGFFVVSENPDDPDLSGYQLTRAGSFRVDSDGNLRNAAGLYLAGFRHDGGKGLGVVDRNGFGDLATVNIGSQSTPGSPTATVGLAGNLPSQDTGHAVPGDPYLTTASIFDPLGATHRLNFSWQPGTAANEWTLSFGDEAGVAYGSVDVAFHDSGPMAGTPMTYSNVVSTAPAPASFAFDGTTGEATLGIDNGAAPQTLAVTLGAPGTLDGITQFAGSYTPLSVEADGTSSGALSRTEFGDDGTLYGVFDNGLRRALYEVPLATVPNANGLRPADGNAYFLSRSSGDVTLSTAGTGAAGSITSGALEGSTVELAEELTRLIQIQRAYSSNAKIVTTVDEMLDETVRIKR
ncbi:flagellar hook-basal body complex protein [Jannaschia sp. Os4]|uniref:flagellar hook protein FlgE n=1 Tax=Jannaschia sp. Os4 TaxID=2807617 RepID=UPI001939ADD1|nr:flagellar hook-basal body complex protein [Jannaschia sp. Os4]MBM2575682.1 flagellar hook-basal body complex protein [Jannaschia sp. Os4]